MVSAVGTTGEVHFDGTLILIVKPPTAVGFMDQKMQSQRHIVARSVTAVVFQDATHRTDGVIAFEFPGRSPSRVEGVDLATDDYAILFDRHRLGDFRTVRDEILSYLTMVNQLHAVSGQPNWMLPS